MISLTTRLSVRDFLAVKQVAKKQGLTESAWVRWLITNSVDIHTEPVDEVEIHDFLLDQECCTHFRKPRKKQPWWKRICG